MKKTTTDFVAAGNVPRDQNTSAAGNLLRASELKLSEDFNETDTLEIPHETAPPAGSAR